MPASFGNGGRRPWEGGTCARTAALLEVDTQDMFVSQNVFDLLKPLLQSLHTQNRSWSLVLVKNIVEEGKCGGVEV